MSSISLVVLSQSLHFHLCSAFTLDSHATVKCMYMYLSINIAHFIYSGYLYSTPSRNLLRGNISPVRAKEKCLKKLAERRHVVPGQQAQCKRKLIPSGRPITEKARRCISAERARGTKSSPRAEERRARREARSQTGLQRRVKNDGHNQLHINAI